MEPTDQDAERRARVLRRSETDRYLGGVAGGIAERFAVDPVLVRVGLACVALSLARSDDGDLHPLVLVPYAALWACLPTSGARSLLARVRDAQARRELALVVVALVLGWIALARPGSLVLLGLGALAVALLRDPPAVEPGSPPVSDATDGGEGAAGPPRSPTRRWAPLGWAPPPASRARRVRRSPALWPLTLGLLVAVSVVGLVLDQATDGGVDPRIVIDVALLAVGGVLVLSGWRGRARITLLALAALVPLWVATSVPDIGRFSGQGTRTVRPTAAPAAVDGEPATPLSYEIGYGRLDVDLRELPLGAGDVVTVRVGVTAGRATVTVPTGAAVRVRGEIGLGTAHVHAPSHFHSDGDPALNRTFDRSYPALGVECVLGGVAGPELVDLAARAGVPMPESAGVAPTAAEVAEAISDAGYPAPVPMHVEDGPVGEEQSDEYGNPVSTTTPRPQMPEEITYWDVQVGHTRYELCRPEPPPVDPPTIIVEPTVGLGALEIRRV